MSHGKPRTPVCPSRIVTVLAVVVGTIAVLEPSAGASPGPRCRVTDLSTNQIYDGTGSNLQTAIDEAQPGTDLRVRGVCVGNFTIDKNLKLFGRSTVAYPTPTLDGNHAGRVLSVLAGSVVLKDLRITNGSATRHHAPGDFAGGGIFNDGTLTLKGSSSVTRNRAGGGGGIANRGTLTLMGSSSVNGNKAKDGGGISNIGGIFDGILILKGSSSVSGNIAAGTTSTGGTRGFAGGVYNGGTMTLDGSSSVSGNIAAFAGGIYNGGTITLNDSSSVSGNTAGDCGGIVNNGTLTLNDSSSVSGNTSDLNGGGVSNGGALKLNDSSSVSGNTANVGGGIHNGFGASLTLDGSSSVTGNTAIQAGGGIFNDSFSTVYACDTWTGAISPNSPDDPPVPTPNTC